jgi:hypothetical protein
MPRGDKGQKKSTLLRDDPAPVLLGHWVSFVRPREGFSEYACVTCGHPFLFSRPARLKAVA